MEITPVKLKTHLAPIKLHTKFMCKVFMYITTVHSHVNTQSNHAHAGLRARSNLQTQPFQGLLDMQIYKCMMYIIRFSHAHKHCKVMLGASIMHGHDATHRTRMMHRMCVQKTTSTVCGLRDLSRPGRANLSRFNVFSRFQCRQLYIFHVACVNMCFYYMYAF